MIASKGIQLLGIENDQRLFYHQKCKVIIDKNCEKLTITTPKLHEGSKNQIVISFDSDFIRHKNFLSVVSRKNDSNSYILITSDEKKSEIIFNNVQTTKTSKTSVTFFETFFNQWICSFLKCFEKADKDLQLHLKQLFNDILISLDETERQKCLDFVKSTNGNSSLLCNTVDICDKMVLSDERNSTNRLARKRKLNLRENGMNEPTIKLSENSTNHSSQSNHQWISTTITTSHPSNIKGSNFELYHFDHKGKQRKHLIVFANHEKTKCYEYSWVDRNQTYFCRECSNKKYNRVKADISKKNGKPVVKFGITKHICEPRKYDPRKYETDIVEAPNFELISFELRGVKKEKLIVFPTSDRKKCYEYFVSKTDKHYRCGPCENLKKFVSAKIYQNADGNDYVKLGKAKHICEMRNFNSEKYSVKFDPSKHIVDDPNFKVITFDHLGTEKQRLFIFSDSKRIHCYEYFWDNRMKKFNCCGCNNKRIRVLAQICTHDDGKQYVKLEATKHICELRQYNPGRYDLSVKNVEAPNYEIISFKENGISKRRLFLFLDDERKQCYQYYWRNNGSYFTCGACEVKKKNIAAKIGEKEDGTEYIRLMNPSHICEPQEYNPNKFFYDTQKDLVVKPNFEVIKFERNGIQKTVLIVFCQTNFKLCYEYFWNDCDKKYVCLECANRKHVSAHVCTNVDGMEYVKLSKTEHICDLRQYEPEKYEKLKVFQKSQFEMVQRIVNGALIKRIFLFTDETKKFCYKFCYLNSTKRYKCSKCSAKHHHISGKLYDKEETFEVSRREHICQPIEYQHRAIVKSPDYQLLKRKIGNNIIQKLVLFDSKNKKLCYEYSLIDQRFRCSRCHHKHKINVNAKLVKNEENEEFVELYPQKHKCNPIKFVPEGNLEVKIVRKPNFQLEEVTEKNGVVKKFLSIFDSADETKCYTYNYRTSAKFFQCYGCRRQNENHCVTARIRHDEENDEDYVVMNDKEHICELKTYEPYKGLRVIAKSDFEFRPRPKGSRAKGKDLIIYTSADRKLWYTYQYMSTDNQYACRKCYSAKQKLTTARLKKDIHGEEYLELGRNEHICKPQKQFF